MTAPAPFRARRRFGQNFLTDRGIIARIVEALAPEVGDNLVEIGPGHAALTEPVLKKAGALRAIELDRDLAALLRSNPALQGLTVVEDDALKVDFSAFGSNLRVFGNLPYNITSPLLFHLLPQRGIRDLHFMLQKEVVQRLCAAPGGGDYGRLTITVGFYAQATLLFEVPPECFYPRPKVTSAVVRLVPRPLSEQERSCATELSDLTQAAFSARRKTLRNALKAFFTPAQLELSGVDPALRPEQLPPELYYHLAAVLKARRPGNITSASSQEPNYA
ncbi:MAG: 16S rRNA (adenine(1518)-N(6)/adenine(1519)-N(6))-dimethyltransferase RsmA [Succinivibrio sp.]|nr:16S rRNA (adenine(1518)-N(6)/adenine(1519)-N(6))-dimethyltransferase RsmA [Succinivibrio sp.]